MTRLKAIHQSAFDPDLLYNDVCFSRSSARAYFVEEQNEVDSEGDKKCQEAEVVEVSGQVIL